MLFNPGCCCDCTATQCVKVISQCSCDGSLNHPIIAGASMVVTDSKGNVVVSGTADGDGMFCFKVPKAGTYTITATNQVGISGKTTINYVYNRPNPNCCVLGYNVQGEVVCQDPPLAFIGIFDRMVFTARSCTAFSGPLVDFDVSISGLGSGSSDSSKRVCVIFTGVPTNNLVPVTYNLKTGITRTISLRISASNCSHEEIFIDHFGTVVLGCNGDPMGGADVILALDDGNVLASGQTSGTLTNGYNFYQDLTVDVGWPPPTGWSVTVSKEHFFTSVLHKTDSQNPLPCNAGPQFSNLYGKYFQLNGDIPSGYCCFGCNDEPGQKQVYFSSSCYSGALGPAINGSSCREGFTCFFTAQQGPNCVPGLYMTVAVQITFSYAGSDGLGMSTYQFSITIVGTYCGDPNDPDSFGVQTNWSSLSGCPANSTEFQQSRQIYGASATVPACDPLNVSFEIPETIQDSSFPHISYTTSCGGTITFTN